MKTNVVGNEVCMVTPKPINKIAIEELRRSYDILNRAVDKLQVKTLTFLAATFALLTYLYNGGDLFIPTQLYGRIFYFIGLSLVLASVVVFLLGLKPRSYKLTTEIKRLKDIKEKTENEYLEYVKNEYIESFSTNSSIYENKHSDFNIGVIFLIIGAFILVVIKTFPDGTQTCYTNKAACSQSPNKSTAYIKKDKEGIK